MNLLKKIDFKYIGICLLAVLFTFIIHETAHWLCSTLLGYETVMTINTTFPVNGKYKSLLHSNLVSVSGPIITIIQALLIFYYLKNKSWKVYLYPFLFTAFYIRFMATVISVFNLNDEARISKSLGLGTYTLPLFVTFFLFYLLYDISKKQKLNWRLQRLTIFLVIFFSSILIMSNQFINIRLL